MRLVKKTVNQDDISRLPSLLRRRRTPRPAPTSPSSTGRSRRERRGTHSIARTGLRVAGPETPRLVGSSASTRAGVAHGDIAERDGRPTLDFEDPEGQRLSLVDDGGTATAPSLGRRAPCRPSTRSAASARSPSASPTSRRPTPC